MVASTDTTSNSVTNGSKNTSNNNNNNNIRNNNTNGNSNSSNSVRRSFTRSNSHQTIGRNNSYRSPSNSGRSFNVPNNLQNSSNNSVAHSPVFYSVGNRIAFAAPPPPSPPPSRGAGLFQLWPDRTSNRNIVSSLSTATPIHSNNNNTTPQQQQQQCFAFRWKYYIVKEARQVAHWAIITSLLSNLLHRLVTNNSASSTTIHNINNSSATLTNAIWSLLAPWMFLFLPNKAARLQVPGLALTPAWTAWLHYDLNPPILTGNWKSRLPFSFPHLGQHVCAWKMGRKPFAQVFVAVITHSLTAWLVWYVLDRFASLETPLVEKDALFQSTTGTTAAFVNEGVNSNNFVFTTTNQQQHSLSSFTNLYYGVMEAVVTALYLVTIQVVPVFCQLNHIPLSLATLITLFPLYCINCVVVANSGGIFTTGSCLSPVALLVQGTSWREYLWRGLVVQTWAGGWLAGSIFMRFFPEDDDGNCN